MKKISLLLCITFFAITLTGQNSIDIKKLEKNFDVSKYCMTKGRAVYPCKFELSNADYSLFLNDLKKSGDTALYNSYLRDSTAWARKFKYSYNDPIIRYYFSHPAYYNHPVVCITYESAMAYCAWLTAKYKESKDAKYTDVVFRLPSKTEWMSAAAASPGASFPWYGCLPYNEKGCYYCNICCDTGNYIEDGAFYPAKIKSYTPNKLGLYNILGNVSEMLADKGIAKGGSWYDLPGEADLRKVQKYEGTDPGVGVRVFMERPLPKNNKMVYTITEAGN